MILASDSGIADAYVGASLMPLYFVNINLSMHLGLGLTLACLVFFLVRLIYQACGNYTCQDKVPLVPVLILSVPLGYILFELDLVTKVLTLL